MTPWERVRAALGGRYAELLAEDPRRRAWEALPEDVLQDAFREAQRHAGTGRAGRSFATLMIEGLDARIGIGPHPGGPEEPGEGDVIDAYGRVHQPDPGRAVRERKRREREARAEDAYGEAYDAARAAGLDDPAAHARALAARADVLRADSGEEA